MESNKKQKIDHNTVYKIVPSEPLLQHPIDISQTSSLTSSLTSSPTNGAALHAPMPVRLLPTKMSELKTPVKAHKPVTVTGKCVQEGMVEISSTVEQQKVEKLIGFELHMDPPMPDQINRTQIMLYTEKVQELYNLANDYTNQFMNTDADVVLSNMDLTRTTVFVPYSHKCRKLFIFYYQVYHYDKCTDTKCPAFVEDLRLKEFNEAFSKLRYYIRERHTTIDNSSTDASPVDEAPPSSKRVRAWYKKLKSIENSDHIIHMIQNEQLPKRFVYWVTKYRQSDIICWIPGVVHCVLSGLTVNKLVVKISSDLSQDIAGVRKEKLDKNGFYMSDGSTAKPARDVENKRSDLSYEQIAAKVDEYSKQKDSIDIRKCISDFIHSHEFYMKNCIQQLHNTGVTIVRGMLPKEYGAKRLLDATAYTQKMMGIDNKTLNLSIPLHSAVLLNQELRQEFNISNENIRRSAGNSRSTVVASGHGITKWGKRSPELVSIYRVDLVPFLEYLYKSPVDGRVSYYTTDICVHLQPPILTTTYKEKKKRKLLREQAEQLQQSRLAY
jgi:hypothetical protein